MTYLAPSAQRGATLLIALVMLVVLTLLAVSSMRGVTLESRITGNRAHTLKLTSAADAALREAEFRFYGPGNLRAKLEPAATNCSAANTLNAAGINKPCLLEIEDDKLDEFVVQPQALDNGTKSEFLTSASSSGLAWMPYVGLDPDTDSEADFDAEWNSTRATNSTDTAINAEYGMAAEGKGTYFYLNNGRADKQLTLQSTAANIYLGLNN